MAIGVAISALPSATSTSALTFPANEGGITKKALTGTGPNTVPYNDASGNLVATLNLGGSITGVLPLINGGTNAALVANNGGIPYSTTTAIAILSGTATANRVLLSGASSAPAWSTATYPVTTTINQLLYSSAGNQIAGLATANNGVLITSAGGVPSIATTLPSVVQGNITAVGTVTSGTWNGSVIDLAHGGTNANLTASNGGIFYSTATAGAILAGTATASKILLSGATAAPTWSTSTIPSSAGATASKVLLSDGTNYVLSTPTFPNASATALKIIRSDGTNWIASTATFSDTPGTAGKVMVSNGTNWVASTPTFPNASATALKFIRSDGTNWIASTSTISDTPGLANLYLRSDGTNWVTSSSRLPDTYAQGDIPFASAGNTVITLAKNTTATRYLSNTGATNNPAWAQVDLTNGVTGLLPAANINTAALSDIQLFTANGTWIKPAVGNTCFIYVVGAGGGGGSGRRGATASGGAAASGGGVSSFTIPKSLLNATETVVVGTKGTGGAAQTVDSTDGNAGTAGGDSIFRHTVNWIIGKGGNPGAGGSTGTVSGAVANTPSDFISGSGGNGNTGTGGVSGIPTTGAAGPGGGGGGNVAGVASNGGTAILPRGGTNTGGTAPGGNGSAGLLSLPVNMPGGGGSGGAGAGDGVTPGGAGGAGGASGGGGGGGGGSADGANSGKGGDGADGYVFVITY